MSGTFGCRTPFFPMRKSLSFIRQPPTILSFESVVLERSKPARGNPGCPSPLQHGGCSMQKVHCRLEAAVCSNSIALWMLQHAVNPQQHGGCSMQQVRCSMEAAACSKSTATWRLQHAANPLQHGGSLVDSFRLWLLLCYFLPDYYDASTDCSPHSLT